MTEVLEARRYQKTKEGWITEQEATEALKLN